MRNFITTFSARLMALFLIFSLSVSSAFAFAHGGLAKGNVEYIKNEVTYHAPFIAGLAIHGEHMMWRIATPDVLAAAQELGFDVSGLAARTADMKDLPTAAFTDDTLDSHINIVHPVHDEVANLVRELNATAAGSPAVLSLNATLLLLREMHRDSAVCAYVAEAAVLNSGSGDTLEYNVDANAELWSTVARVSVAEPVSGLPLNFDWLQALLLMASLGLLCWYWVSFEFGHIWHKF